MGGTRKRGPIADADARDMRGALKALLGIADDEELPFATAVEFEADPRGTIERAWEACASFALIQTCLGRLGVVEWHETCEMSRWRGWLLCSPFGVVVADTARAAAVRAQYGLPWRKS